jgi:spore coat protein CotF
VLSVPRITGISKSLATYTNVIAETNDVQLRSTFQQMRNQDEQRQYQLALTAMQKEYYKPKSSKLSPN